MFRLELDGQGYYLKRQSDLTRSASPVGEPKFCPRISQYRPPIASLGIPALQAARFRPAQGQWRASRDVADARLDGWNDLESLLEQWPSLVMPSTAPSCKPAASWLGGCTALARCAAVLSPAYFPAGDGRRLRRAADRPGENPSAVVRLAGSGQGPGRCCAVHRGGRMSRCANSWRRTSTA